MSLAVPTTKQLSDNIVASLQGKLGQTVPIFSKAFIRVLAKAQAGVDVLLYKYAGFIFLQLFVAYATDREVVVNGKRIRPLVEWGRLVGIGDPRAAERAEHVVTVTVTTQGGELKADTQLVRTETQVIYTVVAPVSLNAPTVAVTVRAVADPSGNGGAGIIGNLQPGDTLAFANTQASVASTAVVASTSKQGVDAESTKSYRDRIMRRFRTRPQGGAYADYQEWASINGIANVYPYAGDTPGVVDVYVEATPESSGSADGIPTNAQLTAVQDAINFDETGQATRRPASAGVSVKPITRIAFNLTVAGLSPNSVPLQEEIEAGVDEYLRSREPYIEGLSVLPREDRITLAAVSGIVDQIVNANGATVTTVTMDPGPALNLAHGQKAKLGVTSWP